MYDDDRREIDDIIEDETTATTTTDLEGVGLETTWRALVGVGIVMALIGLLAIVFPIASSFSLAIVFGAALVVGGFVNVAHAFSAKRWQGFVWQTLLAIVYGIAGILVLANPVLGMTTLTLLLVAYLVVSGLVEIVMGLQLNGQPRWLWLVASGVIGLLLGLMLLAGFPSTAAWAVGLLFGANLLVSGISLIAVAMGTKKLLESGQVAPPATKPGPGV
ncbi:HdeD family acid-resistance protein [Haloarchaeobius sp. TZWWS8]|uniref:HdeD family acid-resistance protein n=1 Tax=Haloarchaeobius sp. TZWWS8 TaxID=3446121 RepID=UPI003EBCE96F